MMGKVLALTGVTGVKSGRVLTELINSNREYIDREFPGGIRAMVREESNTDYLRSQIPDIDIRTGDMTDEEFYASSLEEVDTLIHIAWIRFSKSVVDAAVRCGVRRLILVHTTGVFSKYKSASKLYKEIDAYVRETCEKNGIVLTICRPTMIYGNIYDKNIVRFIRMVDKLPIVPVVNGARYELQPVHYADLGRAYWDVLTHEETTAGREFNLSGGQVITLRDVFNVIGKQLGKDVKFISCPFFIAYIGAWLLFLVTLGFVDYREKVQRLCEPRVFSYNDAAEAFGYAPVTFEEGVKAEIQEYLRSTGR